jgi:hypothetical protein
MSLPIAIATRGWITGDGNQPQAVFSRGWLTILEIPVVPDYPFGEPSGGPAYPEADWHKFQQHREDDAILAIIMAWMGVRR